MIAALLRRLALCRRAAAAVEFAIVLPVALVLYVGAAEVADGVMTSRKVSNVTHTLVDLVSLQSTSRQLTSTPTPQNALTATTLSALLTSAQTLLAPEPTTTLAMTLTAIDVRNNLLGLCCTATVRWSYTQNGTLRSCLVPITSANVPSQLLPTGTILAQPMSYLVADVSYTYQPILGTKLVNFAPTMQRTEYMMPRMTGQVVTGSLPATGTQHGQVCY